MNSLCNHLLASFVLASILAPLKSVAQKEKSVEDFIINQKRINFEDLVHAQSTFKCQNDTIFFPNGLYFGIRSVDLNMQIRPDALNQHIMSLEKLEKYGVHIESIEDVENFFKKINKKYKSNKDPFSSPFVKWLLLKKKEELQSCIKILQTAYESEFKPSIFDNVIFENYNANDIKSEYKTFYGKHIVFLNDRLLSFSESLIFLVNSLTEKVDSAGINLGTAFPKSIGDSISKKGYIRQFFTSSIFHFHYGCPRKYGEYNFRVEKFREYIEMFIMAHEYAHALYSHASYKNKFNELLSEDERRELKLNSWLNEIQADIFAQNVLMAKYQLDFPDKNNLELLTAGGFYLSCVDILEKSRLILKSNNINADSSIETHIKNFEKLIDLVQPFPMSLKEMNIYEVNLQNKDLIDLQINYSHPPALMRADIIFNSILLALKNTPKTTEKDIRRIYFGVDMCKTLKSIYTQSKKDLLNGN